MSDVTPFAFKLVRPALYTQNVVIQAAGYAEAAVCAQPCCTGALRTIFRATNMQTGQVVSNG
ncbi:MAG: hypothetical protein P4L92_18790 [Rudaea sp.]|nr:hypothetical protein [Rudaea sp.]